MQDDFSLESYDYALPQANIAQHPAESRDKSKLLAFNCTTDHIEHTQFDNIVKHFKRGDILVVNDTKVFPARLLGRKESGGKAEVFLLELPREPETATIGASRRASAAALIKSSRRPAEGSTIHISDSLSCQVTERLEGGRVRIELHFPDHANLLDILSQEGSVPLPPYIERLSGTTEEDKARYQTVYASTTGAVAAPTAGLHFTGSVLEELEACGVEIATLTLHVGYGTFAPVRTASIKDHEIHREYVTISEDTASRINAVKESGGRVWAVGTTSVRALEFGGRSGKVQQTADWCDLYIIPGYKFRVIDNLITNFHLPKSSLLFLVSALCGREKLLHCYREAIARDYRFYSYGDAMAIMS